MDYSSGSQPPAVKFEAPNPTSSSSSASTLLNCGVWQAKMDIDLDSRCSATSFPQFFSTYICSLTDLTGDLSKIINFKEEKFSKKTSARKTHRERPKSSNIFPVKTDPTGSSCTHVCSLTYVKTPYSISYLRDSYLRASTKICEKIGDSQY